MPYSLTIGYLGTSVYIYPIFGNAANRLSAAESDSVRCAGRGSPKTRRKWTEKAQIQQLPPTGCPPRLSQPKSLIWFVVKYTETLPYHD